MLLICRFMWYFFVAVPSLNRQAEFLLPSLLTVGFGVGAYGIVLDGELMLVLDHGETTVRVGEIVIQRGTNRAWANRSGNNCRVALC